MVAGQPDLLMSREPRGAEKCRSALASPQNSQGKALQKTDTTRKSKERGTGGRLLAQAAEGGGSQTTKLKPRQKGLQSLFPGHSSVLIKVKLLSSVSDSLDEMWCYQPLS